MMDCSKCELLMKAAELWSCLKRGGFNNEPSRPNCAETTIGFAICELIQAKRLAGRRENYLKGLRQYLDAFAHGRRDLPLNQITHVHIGAWFLSRNEQPATRASNLGRLKSLFSFCVRRGWIEKSPCDALESVRIDQKPPRILTPAEARTLLHKAKTTILPYLVLAMFVGVRPEEIYRLSWGNFQKRDSQLVLRLDVTKTRRRRLIFVNDTARAWLERCNQDLPLCPSPITVRRWRRSVRHEIGGWHQDVLRHTAASYLLAQHKDPSRVAMMLGNSPKILMAHYSELVSDEDCGDFWSIRHQV